MNKIILKSIIALVTLSAPLLAFSQEALLTKTDKFNHLIWKESDKKDWYEWWYFKLVEPKTKKAFYFCYGLVNPWDQKQSREASKAFVSAGSFSQKMIIEERWPSGEFRANKNINRATDSIIEIGPNNLISPNQFQGSIVNENGDRVAWQIKTEKKWEYNAMGWTLFLSDISNIYWFPIQASTQMTGWIDFNGERLEFENVPGYQDRNWGRTFPKWWAWIVSNNFKNSPGTVLASGGGQPKVFGITDRFKGYTIGVTHQGKEYAFKMPNGDKIKVDINFGTWKVQAINKKNQKLELEAFAPREKFMLLPFTTPQGQVFKDYETLNGYARVKLYSRKHIRAKWELVADLETEEAGIEFGSFEDFDLDKVYSSNIKLQ